MMTRIVLIGGVLLAALLSGCGFQRPPATDSADRPPHNFRDPYIAPPAPAGTPSVAEAQARVNASPYPAKAYYRLGLAYYKRHQYPQAIAALERSRRLAPRQAAIYWWLGDAYTASGQPARALPILQQLVRLPLRDPQLRSDAFEMLGNCYWELYRGQEAAQAWQESLRNDPHQPAALLNLGSWATKEHQFSTARAYFQAALRYAETARVRAKAHAGLGILAEAGDDSQAAAREYRLALENDRNNAGATDGLKRLGDR